MAPKSNIYRLTTVHAVATEMFLIQELWACSIPYAELLIRLTMMLLNLSVTETQAESCRRVCDRSFPELHGESALCSKESFTLLGSFPEHEHQM